MYNIIKFEYEDFTIFSISRKDEKVMSFSELWKVKQELTEQWTCMYFPPKKDYVNNANEYHLFTCKEPDTHIGNLELSVPISIEQLTINEILYAKN